MKKLGYGGLRLKGTLSSICVFCPLTPRRSYSLADLATVPNLKVIPEVNQRHSLTLISYALNASLLTVH